MKKYLFFAAAMLAAVSCSNDAEEEITYRTGGGGESEITFAVADAGYGKQSQGGGQSVLRSVEDGYCTDFTAGDACGLYVVRGGAVAFANIRLTASGEQGALTWQPEDGIALGGGLADERYFLYYPYQADMTDKVDASAADAAGFFAPLAGGWTPAADQSTHAAYTAGDLMTAKGSAVRAGGRLTLSFAMTHRMALAVIEMPKTAYRFTDASIPDYLVPVSVDFSDEAKPCRNSDGTYRCIVNPARPATLAGSYGNKIFSITPAGIAAGTYKTYAVDGARVIPKPYTLQPGDWFCKNSDNKWYIIPENEVPNSECIGIVFYTGKHEYDDTDYTATGIGQQTCRGYAVALQDAITNNCEWGLYDRDIGNCSAGNGGYYLVNNWEYPDKDWSGYAHTQRMVAAAGETGSPAAYHALNYGVQAPAGTSGWFLPAIGQLKEAYRLTGDAGFGGDLNYWSSSEYYITRSLSALYIREGVVGHLYKPKNECRVRSILAF